MEQETKQVQVLPKDGELSAFGSISGFEGAQRIATALASSDLVPTTYKGKTANCLVALEISQRCGASVMAVMQNLNIIQGRPAWGSSYIIAALNSCGRFEPIRFKVTGEGEGKKCVAWTRDRQGEVIDGPEVSIAMAKAEGWYDRNGSKWKTMPDLMLRYRAAAFFGRLYAPEILMGMRTDDEEREIKDVQNEPASPAGAASELNKKIREKKTAPAKTPDAILPPEVNHDEGHV